MGVLPPGTRIDHKVSTRQLGAAYPFVAAGGLGAPDDGGPR